MPQEDYLKRQLDQFAKALAKLLSKISTLDVQEPGQHEIAEQMVDDVLKAELTLSMQQLLAMRHDDIVLEISKKRSFTPGEFESLAEIFQKLSEGTEKRKAFQEIALAIYRHLNTTGNTYSLERHFQIEKLVKSIGDTRETGSAPGKTDD